jgi:hypothetical protein
VKFGFALAGVAAGAVPPPPPPPLSVVVVVPVVSVDVDPVDDSVEPVLDESGVVVVIVVTTVVLPVVTVLTIVVVACAPNGAAPAVIAAVTAPSASRQVKAAPQRANLRFLLLEVPYLGGGGATPARSSSENPCSTGSTYILDQATRPSWTSKMITPRSSSGAPLRAVP